MSSILTGPRLDQSFAVMVAIGVLIFLLALELSRAFVFVAPDFHVKSAAILSAIGYLLWIPLLFKDLRAQRSGVKTLVWVAVTSAMFGYIARFAIA